MTAPLTCIPQANGVPALPGPPNWWDKTKAVPDYWDQFDDHDDPRWVGSVRKGYDGGSLEHMSFRALQAISSTEGGRLFLYLAWDVKVDPSVDVNGDGVYLGLQRAGGPAFIIKLEAFDSGTDRLQVGSTVGREVLRQTGTTWTSEPDYAWIGEFSGSWLKNATSTTTSNRWSIHMRIPLLSSGDISNDGINLGDVGHGATFKLWFQVDVDGPGQNTIPYTWPRDQQITQGPNLQDIYPDPANWGDFKVGSDPSCASGISLSPWDVGTTNVDPVTGLPAPDLILFQYPPTPTPPTNHLFANPKNSVGAPTVGAHGLRAIFRIANWGTQPDWNAVPDPTKTLWKEILPAQAKDNATPIPAGSQGSIEFPWTLSDTEAAEFGGPSPSRRPHQCMLVQLAGGGLDFVNDSVYRNMNFKKASKTVTEAEVSVVGLQALAASTHRDVYLFVDTRNMPPEVEQPPPRPDGGPDLRRDIGTHGGEFPISFEDLARYAPTYAVHAYHDTGMRRRKHGVIRKVLAPQTSFGYFVDHAGALYGWDHALAGPGVQRIAPYFYRIRVPNDGAVQVTTTVNGLERPRPWWWRWWKLLLALWEWIKQLLKRLLGR